MKTTAIRIARAVQVYTPPLTYPVLILLKPSTFVSVSHCHPLPFSLSLSLSLVFPLCARVHISSLPSESRWLYTVLSLLPGPLSYHHLLYVCVTSPYSSALVHVLKILSCKCNATRFLLYILSGTERIDNSQMWKVLFESWAKLEDISKRSHKLFYV